MLGPLRTLLRIFLPCKHQARSPLSLSVVLLCGNVVGPGRPDQGSSLFLHAYAVTPEAAQRQNNCSTGHGSGCNHPLPKGFGVGDMNSLPLLAGKM